MQENLEQNGNDGANELKGVAIGIGIGVVVMTIILIAAAAVLSLNVEMTAPFVELIRDVALVALALELIVLGVAVVVLFVQAARLINLVSNEIQPLIEATSDTVNTVRGTAVFLSKNLADPVIQANSTLRGLGRIFGDINAIQKVAAAAAAAAAATSPLSTRSVKRPPATPPKPAGDAPKAGEGC